MHLDPDITLRRIPRASEEEEPKSEICVGGKPTGKIILGAILEAAVRCDSRRLLFLTDDVPFEEYLRILLVDQEFNELDSAQLGAPYSTGSFAALTVAEPDRVQFRFIGDTVWSVRVLDKPQFRVPLVSEPRGVWRRLGFSKHFIIEGNPLPETR